MTTFVGPDSSYFEPPDPEPECRACDGHGTIIELRKEVMCERCDGSGVEPPFDPLDNPELP